MVEKKLETFAALRWVKRWNSIPDDVGVAGLSRSGEDIHLVTCLGYVAFDLHEDGPHLLRQLEAACDLLRKELE